MLKNEEGYKDPTPTEAIKNMTRRRGGVLRESDIERMDATRVHVPTLADISEADEQTVVVTWAGYMVKRYPALKWLYHTPNGGSRNIAEAKQLKKMGVKPGVPDLFLPFPAGGQYGLWIEMKTATGRVMACQREWIEYLRSVGYAAYVCRGADEAICKIEDYLKGRTENDE